MVQQKKHGLIISLIRYVFNETGVKFQIGFYAFVLIMLGNHANVSYNKKKGGMGDMMPSGDGLMQMLGGFSILRIASMASMANITFTKEQLLDINKKLNKIKKK